MTEPRDDGPAVNAAGSANGAPPSPPPPKDPPSMNDQLLPDGTVRLGFDKYGRPAITRFVDSDVVLGEPPVDPPTPPTTAPTTWQSKWQSKPAPPRLDRQQRRHAQLLDERSTQ